MVLFLAEIKRFSLLQSFKTGSGIHPASKPKNTGFLFQGDNQPGYESDHLSPSNAEENMYFFSPFKTML
jgi:hypothetical protein